MQLLNKQNLHTLFLQIMNPIKAYDTSEQLQGDYPVRIQEPVIGDVEKASSIEADLFAALWGLVPFWLGNGHDESLERVCRGIMISSIQNEYQRDELLTSQQRLTELVAVAYGITMVPDILWNPYTKEEREMIKNRLMAVCQKKAGSGVRQIQIALILVALEAKGAMQEILAMQEMQSGVQLEKVLDELDLFYLKYGWYRNEMSSQKDYRQTLAIQYYSLLYLMMRPDMDQERKSLYQNRALEFGKQYFFWMDEEGAVIPFGAPLHQRFEQMAFWAACIAVGVEPFTLSEMKGFLVRNLRFWRSQPIFDKNGWLTDGYAYPNQSMQESEEEISSAYLGVKAFICMALPDEHCFWNMEPASHPSRNVQVKMKHIYMIVQNYDYHSTLFVPGNIVTMNENHQPEKYGKFAYDSRFGFSFSRSMESLSEAAPDSMLAFLVQGKVYVRKVCEQFDLETDEIISEWSPLPGIRVITKILPTKLGHIREHEVYSEIPCLAFDCGFAVASGSADGYMERIRENKAIAENRFSSCTVNAVEKGGTGYLITAASNTNIYHKQTKIPCVEYQIEGGFQYLRTVIIASVY